jgi:hypothetical protein
MLIKAGAAADRMALSDDTHAAEHPAHTMAQVSAIAVVIVTGRTFLMNVSPFNY